MLSDMILKSIFYFRIFIPTQGNILPKDSMPKEDILPKDFMPKVKNCSNAWRAFSGLKSAICIFQQNLSKIMVVMGLKFKIGQNRLISG